MRVCKCDWCVRVSPILEEIEKILKGEHLLIFNELVDRVINIETELECAEAKLSGDWPRWEFMKEVLKERKDQL